MLKLLYNFSRAQHFYLACSGGVDSMAAADFFRRGNKKFTLAYFDHGTPQSKEMKDFIFEWSRGNNIPMIVGELDAERKQGESPEEYWRNQRYKFFETLESPVVTCHHLNDVAETWIFSALNGNPKIISPNRNNHIFRPFLTNEKQKLVDWCVQHDVKWVEDNSNENVNFPRNRIRHNIMKEALAVNPGLLKVMKKKVIDMVLG